MPNLSTTLFVSILLIYTLVGYSLEERKRKGKTLWLHESGPAIVLGAALGLFVSHSTGGNKMLEISDKTFFYFVLPPIIFAQGYGLKKRNFFKYFHFITVFGILGTFLQFAFMTGSLYLLAGGLDVTVEREDGVSKVRVERGRQSTYELKLSLQPSISAMN
jgi:NhaP-type Na+/H+ or K+/H+ antiporter